MKKTLSSCNTPKEIAEQTLSIREALYPYNSLIGSYSTGPQSGLPKVDQNEMPHVWINIPAGIGETANVFVTAYVDGTCKAFYDYHDEETQELLGGEEYTLTFDSLIAYLEQLPKPFFAYTSGLVEE